jgi:hypothetical protein
MDIRMTGSARRNLLMFKKLSGPDAIHNVMLVTTMWEKLVTEEEGAARKQELETTPEFWGDMLKLGAPQIMRHDNNPDSAWRLISQFVKKKAVALKIQDEIANHNTSLEKTDAGRAVDSELAKERERWEREMAQAKKDLEEALRLRDEESARILQEEQQRMEKRLAALDQDRRRLKVSLEKMHEERYAQLEEELEEVRRQLYKQQLAGSRPRTRSHPKPNRIQEYRCITLMGQYYYFCGPDSNEGYVVIPPSTARKRRQFS